MPRARLAGLLSPLLLLLCLLRTPPTLALAARQRVRADRGLARSAARAAGAYSGPSKIGVGALRAGYNPMDRPTKGSGAADAVTVAAKLAKLVTISEIDELLTAEMVLVLQWKDARLRGVVPADAPAPQRVDPMQIWTPGITLANAIAEPEVLSEGVHLSHDGTVRLVRNVLYSATVVVDVRMFPFDVQSMEMLLECPDYDGAEVAFLVDAAHSTTAIKSEAVWLLDEFTVAQDMRESLSTGAPDSYLVVTVSVRRLFGMACVTLVSPLFIISNFSFVALFVFIGDFGSRVGIVSTGFLTMIAFLFVINEHLPKIAYWTWLHQYMMMSIISVLIVLIEVVFVHSIDPQGEAAEDEREDPMRLTLKRDKTLLVDKQLAEEGLRAKRVEDERAGKVAGGLPADETGSCGGSRPGSVSGRSDAGDAGISDDLLHAASIAYNTVDTDRSGVIDVHELMAALIHVGYKGVSVKMAQNIISEYNFDGFEGTSVAGSAGGGARGSSPLQRETMSRSEFIAFVADSDVFRAKIDAAKKEQEGHTVCGMGPAHAAGINYWCKRIVPLTYLGATLLMLFVAHVFTAHKRGENSVAAELALAGREVAPAAPSASAMLRR
jgi:hypothetical protein